jgi:hypothetical protein
MGEVMRAVTQAYLIRRVVASADARWDDMMVFAGFIRFNLERSDELEIPAKTIFADQYRQLIFV